MIGALRIGLWVEEGGIAMVARQSRRILVKLNAAPTNPPQSGVRRVRDGRFRFCFERKLRRKFRWQPEEPRQYLNPLYLANARPRQV